MESGVIMATKSKDELIYIDKNRLDEEWMRQSYVVWDEGKEYNRLVFERDTIKRKLDSQIAGLELDIRENPENFGFSTQNSPGKIKITEGAIQSFLLADEELLEIRKELLEKEFEVNTQKTLLQALHHKKSALEYLVKLYLNGYWAAKPIVPDEFGQVALSELEKQQKEAFSDSMDEYFDVLNQGE